MNDRFRFRVWVTVGDKWCGDTNVPYMDYEDIIIKNGGTMLYEWWDGAEEHEGEYVVMQSTGLKDKNEKLIFEGDIIHGEYGMAWEVFHENSMYYIGGHSGDTYITKILEPALSMVSSVIGNIYEHPELLNE